MAGIEISDNEVLKTLHIINDAFVILDNKCNFTYVNKKAASFYGKSPKDLLGKNLWSIFPYIKKHPAGKAVKQAMKEHKPLRHTYFSSGAKKWLEVHYYPSPSGIALFYTDVTEKKMLEEQLKKQAKLIDTANEAMMVLNDKSVITYWNHGAEELYGWTAQEAMGKKAYKLLKTEYPQPLQHIIDTLRKKKDWHGLLTHTTKDKRKILVSSRWSPTITSEGLSIMEVNRDITQHLVTTRELHDAKAQLEAVLANVQDGILVQDVRGKFLFANKSALELFGLDVASTATLNPSAYEKRYEFYDEQGNVFPVARLAGRRVIAGEKRVTEILRIVHKTTGKTYWVKVTASPVLDRETKKPSLVVSVLTDITRFKQTEITLRFIARSGEILSSSLDYKSTLAHIADLAVEYLADWCSVEMLDDTGVDMVAVSHKDPKQIMWAKRLREKNPVDLSEKTGLAKVLKTGVPEFYPVITDDMLIASAKTPQQLKLLRKIGFSSVIIVPLIVNGKVLGAIQLVSTTSKRYFTSLELDMALQLASRASLAIENAMLYTNLQTEQQRLYDVVSNVPGIVWEAYETQDTHRTRPGFVATYVSKYAETMLGYSVNEWIGNEKFWRKMLHPEDFERVWQELSDMYKKGKGGIIQCRCITKDGRTLWVEMQSKPIINAQGKVIGLRGVTMDITKQKELDQRKDDFISMASHELKTPLTSAKVLSQVIKKRLEKTGDVESKKFVDKVSNQIDRLTDLVRELLDVTRLQQKKIELKKEVFLVRELAEEVIENIQPSTTHKLILDWQTKLPVYADKDRIRQVLINFVTNAVKYSPEGKEIRISSRKKDHKILVSVKDLGKGIPESEQKKIFDRFYQSPDAKQGLGLGLYISAEIIKMHGGEIGVISKKGKGSTFYFMLPIHT